jgi:hypothetical protein
MERRGWEEQRYEVNCEGARAALHWTRQAHAHAHAHAVWWTSCTVCVKAEFGARGNRRGR